jgi:regulator of extracellular matrix RemA (YlzA/DUF370 family)
MPHPTQLLLATLRLGGGAAPERLRAVWRATPTPGLERLVEFEGCALWLYRRLAQIGAAGVGGGPFTAWVARRARDAAARNLLVDTQATDVVRTLTAHDIPHVLLKGVARRAVAQRLPFADARATHDVDVLVPAARAEQAWLRLRAHGYELVGRAGGIRTGHFHLPPLWNASRVAVELHTASGPHVSPAEAWRRATIGGCELARDGVQVRVPAATELLWHGLTHALRHGADTFRLRVLLDGAAILAAGVELDWAEIEQRLGSAEAAPAAVARAWLVAAAELAGTPLPGTLRPGPFRLDLVRALRWRCSVLRLLPPSARLAGVLAGEGSRLELGQEWSDPPRRAAPLRHSAQRLRAAAARGAYRLWRAADATPESDGDWAGSYGVGH